MRNLSQTPLSYLPCIVVILFVQFCYPFLLLLPPHFTYTGAASVKGCQQQGYDEREKGKGARKAQDRYDSHVNVFKVCDNGCDVAAPTRVRENGNLNLGTELQYTIGRRTMNKGRMYPQPTQTLKSRRWACKVQAVRGVFLSTLRSKKSIRESIFSANETIQVSCDIPRAHWDGTKKFR